MQRSKFVKQVMVYWLIILIANPLHIFAEVVVEDQTPHEAVGSEDEALENGDGESTGDSVEMNNDKQEDEPNVDGTEQEEEPIIDGAEQEAEPSVDGDEQNEPKTEEVLDMVDEAEVVAAFDYTFIGNKGDGIKITGYAGPGGELSVPEQIEGEAVQQIGQRAFQDKGLTVVVIPESVTAIENGAFLNNELTMITMFSMRAKIGNGLLTDNNDLFRAAYRAGGAGEYTGTQNGEWARIAAFTDGTSDGSDVFVGSNMDTMTGNMTFSQMTTDFNGNLGFEYGLEGWTTHGTVTVMNDEVEVEAGTNTWGILPKGSRMAVLLPSGESNAFVTLADAMNLSAESRSYITGVFPGITDVAFLYTDIELNAGDELEIGWNYVATDYAPYNDASLATLVNLDHPDSLPMINGNYAQVEILGATVLGTGNYSTGNFGSTGWQLAKYRVFTSGTYRLGFAAFNLMDIAYPPYLFIDDGRGLTYNDGEVFDPIEPDDNAPSPPMTTSVTYSPLVFTEGAANDGSIDTVVEIELMNETFTGEIGSEISDVTISNLPTGLTPVITKTGFTTASMILEGMALQHGTANNANNLTISFGDSAFTGGDAVAVMGSTIDFLSIVFEDNPVVEHQLTIDYETADGSTAPVAYTALVTYDEAYSVTTPAVAGYTPDQATVTGTMPAAAVTITVTYAANINTPYKVEHYTENLDGNWQLTDTENLTGITNTTASASLKTYTGFSQPDTTQSGKIEGDDSTVIRVEYTRNQYTFAFNSNGGSDVDAQQYYFEETAEEPDVPLRSGYNFRGWYKDPQFTETWDFDNDRVLTDHTMHARWARNSSSESTPQPTPTETVEETDDSKPLPVTINDEVFYAGTETMSTEDGRRMVTIIVNGEIIEESIRQAALEPKEEQKNYIEIPVFNNTADEITVALTGDMVKQLEEADFNIIVATEGIRYSVPASEIGIEAVAAQLNVDTSELKHIEMEIQITTVGGPALERYYSVAAQQGNELLFPPTEFVIKAKTTRTDGTSDSVFIDQFSRFTERVFLLAEEVDPGKITTGVVFKADATYQHVPTDIFEKDNRWYAKISSLTNSVYSVVWNPVELIGVENHWSRTAVNDMASRLIIPEENDFEPDQAINRGEFAMYIVSALGLYREDTPKMYGKFSDIPREHEAYRAIMLASQWGIVSGYPDGTFKAEGSITREEAMTMYAKAMAIAGLEEVNNDSINHYTDKELIAGWAYNAVKKTVSAGVFSGRTKETINPKDTYTHGEAAAAIRNLLIASGLINK